MKDMPLLTKHAFCKELYVFRNFFVTKQDLRYWLKLAIHF